MVLIARAFRLPGSKPPSFVNGSARSVISDMNAVEAFVIGDCDEREALSRLIRERSSAPVLCLNERHSLDDTLCLFAAGADDVLRKPVHVREIVARVGAINRRVFGEKGNVTIGELRVYFDGREPEVNGQPFPLPRRERRILEFLLRCRGRRVSKTQIFNAVYGLFDEDVDENVIESHISKLRKKLKHRLGFDPIEFQAVPRLLRRETGCLTRSLVFARRQGAFGRAPFFNRLRSQRYSSRPCRARGPRSPLHTPEVAPAHRLPRKTRS